jgi:hypothetical protein
MSLSPFIVRQAEDVVPTRKLVAVGIGSLLSILAGVGFSAWILLATEKSPELHGVGPKPSAAPDQIGILEQTEITEANRGRHLNEAQREELGRYRWVDRSAGIASIPIERAMDIVAAGDAGPREAGAGE